MIHQYRRKDHNHKDGLASRARALLYPEKLEGNGMENRQLSRSIIIKATSACSILPGTFFRH